MDDGDILGRIGALVAKEHELEQLHVGTELEGDEATELRQLEVSLDQCVGISFASVGPGGRLDSSPTMPT